MSGRPLSDILAGLHSLLPGSSSDFGALSGMAIVKTFLRVFLLSLLLGACSSQAVKTPQVAAEGQPDSRQIDDLESKRIFDELSGTAQGAIASVNIQGRSAVSVRVEQHYWSASGKRCVALAERAQSVNHAICLSPNGLHSRVTVP